MMEVLTWSSNSVAEARVAARDPRCASSAPHSLVGAAHSLREGVQALALCRRRPDVRHVIRALCATNDDASSRPHGTPVASICTVETGSGVEAGPTSSGAWEPEERATKKSGRADKGWEYKSCDPDAQNENPGVLPFLANESNTERDMPKFGEVIAERRLVVRSAPKKRVVVSLGTPRPRRGETDWECPFRIRGAGITSIEYGYGLDSVQALTTALEGIRAALDKSGQSLSWEDVLPDETGFQRFIPISFGTSFSRRLERLLDREMKRQLQSMRRRQKGQLDKRHAAANGKT